MAQKFKNRAVAGILIGGLLIVGAGTVALANGNAYQNYKQAAFKTMEARNVTVNSQVEVKQDDQLLVTGTALMQSDGQSHYMSTQIDAGGQAMDLESAQAEDIAVTRMGDQYFSAGIDYQHGSEDFNVSPSGIKLMEMVTDLLVGDVKNHFTSDGDSISVSLEGAQIPELVNVAAAAVVEQMTNHDPVMQSHEPLANVLNQLAIKQNVQVQTIHLNATLKEGYLSDNTITVMLTGSDEQGMSHTLELSVMTQVSDMGATQPSTLDVSGQNVQPLNRFHQ